MLQGNQEMAQLLVAAGACSGRGGATQVGQDHPALRAVALAAQRGRVGLIDLLFPPLARALHGGCVRACHLESIACSTLKCVAERGCELYIALLQACGPQSEGAIVRAIYLTLTCRCLRRWQRCHAGHAEASHRAASAGRGS